jgi:hypothetical protein
VPTTSTSPAARAESTCPRRTPCRLCLAKGAVNAKALATGAVTSAALGADAVTASALAPGSVYGGALGPVTVHTAPIVDVDAVAENGTWTASASGFATCGLGERLLSGGILFTNPGNREVGAIESLPLSNSSSNGIIGRMLDKGPRIRSGAEGAAPARRRNIEHMASRSKTLLVARTRGRVG